MVLPKRLEINIPPAVTAVAEAAVGRDVVMKAVASAVLQADALENALIAALPLGPQSAAGGVSLPDTFQGELQVKQHIPLLCKANFLVRPAACALSYVTIRSIVFGHLCSVSAVIAAPIA